MTALPRSLTDILAQALVEGRKRPRTVSESFARRGPAQDKAPVPPARGDHRGVADPLLSSSPFPPVKPGEGEGPDAAAALATSMTVCQVALIAANLTASGKHALLVAAMKIARAELAGDTVSQVQIASRKEP